jgi:hypothetical protein
VTIAKLKKRAPHKHPSVKKAPSESTPFESRSALAEHGHRIGILGKRIDAFVQFMSKIDQHAGHSEEVRTRAALAFYERLVFVECQLSEIHNAYQME